MGYGMKRVEPIYDDHWVSEFARHFKETNYRNYVMFMMGVYTGLRISDILPIRKADIMGTHLALMEQKTQKLKRIVLHPNLQRLLKEYTADMKSTEYLFPSRKKDYRGRTQPIGRKRAYDIIKEAADEIGYDGNLGTHSMRKTFGVRYYREFKDLSELMEIFNHSSEMETANYLGIMREKIDDNIASMKGINV